MKCGNILLVSIRFRALKHRNFQLFFAGQLVSLIGTWMQSTAQLWLVYRMTNSPALLGIFGFASQIPILFLASLGGYVGDRYNRHRGVIWTQTTAMILSFVLAALTLIGAVRVWEIILIAFFAGIVNAFDVPIRQAFLVQMVGKEDLPNAIALNSSIFNGARIVGPALSGFAGVGAIVGALHFAGRTDYKGLVEWIAATSTTCSLGIVLFSQSRVYWLSAVALLAVGFSATSQMAATNTMVQGRVPDELRGRIMAVYATMFMGVQPLGALIAGGVAKRIGAPHALTAFGTICFLGSLFFVFRVAMRLGDTQAAREPHAGLGR